MTVQTWIHVVRKDLTVAGGNVPSRWIRDQMTVLNQSFGGATGGASTGFAFELAGVTRTTNKKWFDLQGGGEDRAMKRLLKVGGVETLNIYTANLGKNLLGYAYLAQDAAKVGELDGVVVHFQSLPGGNFAIYSEGDTATHEVGHWFDLFHTFDGGCAGGDMVDDTAPEASPAFNCPVGRDTCVDGGLDPITNFMDYTQDSCMFEFTAGQAVRMQQAWAAFRAPDHRRSGFSEYTRHDLPLVEDVPVHRGSHLLEGEARLEAERLDVERVDRREVAVDLLVVPRRVRSVPSGVGPLEIRVALEQASIAVLAGDAALRRWVGRLPVGDEAVAARPLRQLVDGGRDVHDEPVGELGPHLVVAERQTLDTHPVAVGRHVGIDHRDREGSGSLRLAGPSQVRAQVPPGHLGPAVGRGRGDRVLSGDRLSVGHAGALDRHRHRAPSSGVSDRTSWHGSGTYAKSSRMCSPSSSRAATGLLRQAFERLEHDPALPCRVARCPPPGRRRGTCGTSAGSSC